VWGLLGLIHDFDWEIHPTLEEHPSKGAVILRERGVTEDLIQDILSHGIGTGCRATPDAEKPCMPVMRSPGW